jgi:catechol 2,3-dioxygenase-like lactoylglutathione lyase family enzyme
MNGETMPPKTLQLPGLFGVYLQVPDLERSLAFYRDLLGLEVSWSDGALAILYSRTDTNGGLVIREISADARHDLGEAGVTRLFWKVGDPAELDSAEKLLARHDVQYQRHRDETADGITLRDPDGLHIVLVALGEDTRAGAPPAWLYWQR